jgi:archaeal flagellin FlaB
MHEMRPLFRVSQEKDMGAIGIGTMIIFIAMVLVAGIAASVLIQTSSRLESQAMATGEQTTSEVATGLSVEQVQGYAASTENIKFLAIEVRPRSGSREIDLSETLITLSNSSVQLVLTYNNSVFTNKSSINGNLFADASYVGLDANEFGVIVLEDADGSCTATTPVINRGDKVILTVNVGDSDGFNTVEERTDVSGSVIPEEGSPGIIAFRTPSSYTKNVMILQ